MNEYKKKGGSEGRREERKRGGREERDLSHRLLYMLFFSFVVFLYQDDQEARKTRETESVMPEMCPKCSD